MNKVSFYLLTDSHFVSKSTWVEGKPFTFRERTDQIALKATPEILDTFIEKIIADTQTDTVLFTGDNVNNCDMASHYEFRQRLEKLTDAGKKVYVIYATHDYSGAGEDNNTFEGCVYTETGTQPAESMRKSGLFDFYYNYGPAQALSVHRPSGSFTVQLGDGVRLISIIDNGNGGGYCGLDEDGFAWLKAEIKSAKESGNFVLLATHHPVLPPWEVYARLAEHELFGGYKKMCDLMCEENVKVIFTGHTHVQNIKKYTDSRGRWFVDISTVALANAAGKMRKVTVDADKAVCEITSVGAEKINALDTGEVSSYEYLYHLNFPGIWEKLIPLSASDFKAFLDLAEGYLPYEKLKKHKSLIGFAGKEIQRVKLSTAAKLGCAWGSMTPSQKQEAKNKKLIDTAFVILKHIYTGNAPFTPDTVENIAISAVANRLDKTVNRFNVKAVKKIIPDGSSLREIAQDFLYNCRTGDDDGITLYLD